MRLLLRLYPAAWRARYEEEFLAVLEERPLSPFDVFDIALGALDARLRSRSLAIDLAPRRTHPMNARLAGFAAVGGGILILVMVALGFALPQPQSEMAFLLYPPAAVALLVALIGLSAVQGRRRQVLTWAAVAIPVAGALVSLVGMVSMLLRGDAPVLAGLSGWHVWSFGMLGLIVGSVLFAAATVIVGVFSRLAASVLLAGSALLTLAFVPGMLGVFGSSPPTWFALPIGVGTLLFTGGWIWLGYAAARRRPLDAPAAAA